MNKHMCIYMCIYIYIYIHTLYVYIYINRERERDIDICIPYKGGGYSCRTTWASRRRLRTSFTRGRRQSNSNRWPLLFEHTYLAILFVRFRFSLSVKLVKLCVYIYIYIYLWRPWRWARRPRRDRQMVMWYDIISYNMT